MNKFTGKWPSALAWPGKFVHNPPDNGGLCFRVKPAATFIFISEDILEKKPKIILSSQDLERLETLLYALGNNLSPDKAALLEELGRADVLEPQEIPPTVVTMNSTVRFTVENKEEFRLTLVYPKDVDGQPDRISVLAPVGSALLGLSVGDSMAWPMPGGVVKVTIEELLYQPERAGEFHR